MFKRIAVAYSESPETRCAVTSAIHLAKTLGAELRAIIVLQAPSAYRASAEAVDPSLKKIINSEQVQAYEQLHSQAYEAALRGVNFETHLLGGEELDAIVHFLADHKTDLLVVGLIITDRTYHVYGGRFMHLHRMLLAASSGSTKTRPSQLDAMRILQTSATNVDHLFEHVLKRIGSTTPAQQVSTPN